MKRTITSTIILLMSCAANAQSLPSENLDPRFSDGSIRYETAATNRVLSVFALYSITIIILSIAIITFVKIILDYRIKNKLIEKGASDALVNQLLKQDTKDNKYVNIKWFAILAGIGIGLLLVNKFRPLGILSLAIMSLSLSATFLGYYIFTKQSDK